MSACLDCGGHGGCFAHCTRSPDEWCSGCGQKHSKCECGPDCRCATLRPGDDCPAHPFDPTQYKPAAAAAQPTTTGDVPMSQSSGHAQPTTTGGEADGGPPVKDRDGNVWRWHREPGTGDEWEQVWVCCGGPYIERPHGHYADCPTTADLAPSVTPDSDQLRDEIAGTLTVHDWVWSEIYDERRCACGVDAYKGMDVHHADALLSGPVGQLLREHTERGEALERVRRVRDALAQATSEAEAEGATPAISPRVVLAQMDRALDGGA